ncbi:MAG: prolyl oligopeptidase family serine peptidase [Bacteroidales bacterium]|nr:prolyl oligopeptidase family serine peptidase [Bacteroidales bacterium]
MNFLTKKNMFAVAVMSALATLSVEAQSLKMTNQVVRVTAYEASTAVNLVVVKPEKKVDVLDANSWVVETNGVERKVKIVYTCDDRGEWADGGEYLAFGLEYTSDRKAAPLIAMGMGRWSEAYPVKVSLKKGKSIKVEGKKVTTVECETAHALKNFLSESDFFRMGTFSGPSTGKPGIETLTYGAYEPSALRFDGKKNPLIIWLHGGGEGGTDVSITLMGNEVVSLIRNDIQSHFTTEGGETGAYVLSVQCPTMWMNTSKGFANAELPSLYSDVLKSTIDHYLDENPDVDRNRISIGGCSNGGYMTVNMLIRHPRFFAAAFPTCEAYLDSSISDVQIKTLAEENIWFVQSYDDTTVDPKTFCIPTYKRLMKAGAKNVWMSMFEDVTGIDMPGQKLYGHFSWCYVFNDAVTGAQEQTDGDMKPSNNGGGAIAPQGHANLFEWMNAQVLTAPESNQYNPFLISNSSRVDKDGKQKY